MPTVKTAEGVSLYYESVGEGPPIIFHSHHHRTWMYAQVPFFSRYFQAIAYDRRGTGRSDSPLGDWRPEDLSRDCVGLMDALGLEKAIVVGASTGGLMTLQFGVDYRDRVSALVGTNFTWWMWDLLVKEYWEPILQAVEDGAKTTAEIIELIARTPVRSWEWETTGPPLYGPEFQASQFLQLLQASGTISVGESRESLRSLIRLNSKWDLRSRMEDLRSLNVPTLLMVGKAEPTHLIGNTWELYKLMPRADFVLLEGHHMSRFEQASRYNSEIVNFLDRYSLLPAPTP